ERRRTRLKTVARVAVPAAVGVLALAFLPGWLRPAVDRARLRTGRVERGAVEGTFTPAGRGGPACGTGVPSPAEARVLHLLVRPGGRVEAGKPLVELDLGALRLDAGRADEALTKKRNEAMRERLRLDGELAGLGDQREEARLDHQ